MPVPHRPSERFERRPSPRLLLGGLLTTALALHELGYLLARTACERADGIGLAVTIGVAVLVAGAWSLALTPLLARSPQGRRGLGLTLAIAIALLTIFVSQEAMESVLLGDHPAAAQATLAVLAPLSLALGALASRLSRLLFRVAVALVFAITAAWGAHPRTPASRSTCPRERGRAITATPLARGLATRPPPAFA